MPVETIINITCDCPYCSGSTKDEDDDQPVSVYSEIQDVDHYDAIGPSTYDETGYMNPVDDGSLRPHSTMPLPSPSPSDHYDVPESTTSVGDPTGDSSQSAPSRDFISPTAAAFDEAGYTCMVLVDDRSPGPHSTLPLPDPPQSNHDSVPEPTTAVGDPSGVSLPDAESRSEDTVKGPTTTTYDEAGYMVPVDDGSSGPYYTVPIPSPPPTYCNVVEDSGQA